MRTTYDIEMMRQVGFCSGIENYSPAHRRPRGRARAPNCLLDYFPEDFLLVIDESHVTVPQIGGMYEGDMSRKRNLVEHGFRLPQRDGQPAADAGRSSSSGSGRPSTCRPPRGRTSSAGSTATWSSRSSGRPGWSTPRSCVKPTKGQIDDLIARDPGCAPSATSGCWSRR